jgi:predicted membrane protein
MFTLGSISQFHFSLRSHAENEYDFMSKKNCVFTLLSSGLKPFEEFRPLNGLTWFQK